MANRLISFVLSIVTFLVCLSTSAVAQRLDEPNYTEEELSRLIDIAMGGTCVTINLRRVSGIGEHLREIEECENEIEMITNLLLNFDITEEQAMALRDRLTKMQDSITAAKFAISIAAMRFALLGDCVDIS